MSFFLKNFMFWRWNRKRRIIEIAPDEIMLDSRNLPDFDRAQFEGRMGKPISKLTLFMVVGVFGALIIVFLVQSLPLQSGHLQSRLGEEYLSRSEKNPLRPIPIFAGRGVFQVRDGRLLAWNSPSQKEMTTIVEDAVAIREYATSTGLAHILGYVQYPSKDKNGFYYQDDFEGIAGAEEYFNESLQGVNGSRLVEGDAFGTIA